MNNQLAVKRNDLSFITKTNVIYAFIPMFFAWVLTLPIVEDKDVSFALTNAYSSLVFFLFMAPASLLLFIGSSKKWVRIALSIGTLACIAVPFIDVALDFKGLETAVRSFERYCRVLGEQTGYRYFSSFKRNFMDYLGLAWLIIPAFVLNIVTFIGFKYQPRTEALPSLDVLKNSFQSADMKNVMTHLDKEKIRSFGNEVKKQASNVKIEKLTQQLNVQSSANIKKKPVLIAVIVVLALVIGLALIGNKGPSESEVIELVSPELSEAGFDIEIYEYDISNCEEGLGGTAFRCKVTASVTLAKTTGKTFTMPSSIKDEWRTFTYKDGFLEAKLEYLLDTESQQKIALSAISDMFDTSSNKKRNRW